ncbi:CS054 protein, partial [Bucco capensis]|nr:CS054 protein [Bucco capensis]
FMALPFPPPPPPPPVLPPPPSADRVLRDALERASNQLGQDGGVRELLRRRRESLSDSLQWLLFQQPAPPLIQDGPQCGLVALWMAASLLSPSLPLPFLLPPTPAADMAALAQELFPCHAEVLSGGLEGPNLPQILQHLVGGLPLLVPYDEDSNHEPCCRRGHKAHWAVLTGVLLGIQALKLNPNSYQQDPDIPNLFHPLGRREEMLAELLGRGLLDFGGGLQGVLLLAQQGKSPRCQLWGSGVLHGSNGQLEELSPRRCGGDGHSYVVPPGGLGEGLRGRVVMLYP